MLFTKNKRLIFYTGQIAPLDLFTQQLNNAFIELGYNTFIFDYNDQANSVKALGIFCQQPVDAVITFNTMFFNLNLSDGKNAWRSLNIPYITILVDHPINFLSTLSTFSDNEIVLCIDRNHTEYIKRFCSNIHTFGFLPHGGTLLDIENNTIPFHKRYLDVFYAGGLSYSDINTIILPNSLIDKYHNLFDAYLLCKQTFNYLITNNTLTLENAIEHILSTLNVNIDDQLLSTILYDFKFIHLYILSHYRTKTLKAIATAGIELYICGNGWYDLDWISLPNVHLMGLISPEQVLKEMTNAKITLSTMAWFKDGSHERIFNGLLAKSLVVSENTKYVDELFNGYEQNDQQDLLLYNLDSIDSLPKRINYMLNNPDIAQEIIERGYQKAKDSHLWFHRANELVNDLLSL